MYHEPTAHSTHATAVLTEIAVQKINADGPPDLMISSFGPYMEYDSIIASTRFNILTALMKVYNNHLSSVHKESLHAMCKMCVKVLIQPNQSNFKMNNSSTKELLVKYSHVISKGVARIQPTPQFLVDLSSAVHFCLFNDVIIDGRRALERIHSTALYYLFPDVLMVSQLLNGSCKLIFSQLADDSRNKKFTSLTMLPSKSGE